MAFEQAGPEGKEVTSSSGLQYIVQGVGFLNAAQAAEREDETAYLR